MKEIARLFWSDEDAAFVAQAMDEKYLGLKTHGSTPDRAICSLIEAQALVDEWTGEKQLELNLDVR